MSTVEPSQPIEIFISYSHKDEKLRERLETALALLKRQNAVAGWSDRKISAGSEWKGQIDAQLNHARIILLLVSADFIASDYCYDLEMKRAMERHDKREATVIPIILRPCDWQDAPFGKLQALPKDGKAVTKWTNMDEAFTNIAKGIKQAIQEYNSAADEPQPTLPSEATKPPRRKSEPIFKPPTRVPPSSPPSLAQILLGRWQIQFGTPITGMIGQLTLELIPNGSFNGQLMTPMGLSQVSGQWQLSPMNQLVLQGQQTNGFQFIPYMTMINFTQITPTQLTGVSSAGEQGVWERIA